MKKYYTRGYGNFDLTLSTNGTFRMKEIIDITAYLNDNADDQTSFRVDSVKGSIRINVYQYAFGGPLSPDNFQVILLKLPYNTSPTETESTTSGSLETVMEEKISDEFSYRVLKTMSRPFFITTKGDFTQNTAYFQAVFNFVFPKTLQKEGHGATSTEHLPQIDDTFKIVLCILVYNQPASGATSTIGVKANLQFQFKEIQRMRKLPNF